MQNFWTSQSALFSNIQQESRKLIVHPAIAAMIEHRPGLALLDYGCGDGSFVLQLQPGLDLHLYDISTDFLQEAAEKLSNYMPVVHASVDTIPTAYFDYVVSSLVLMTLASKDAIANMLQHLRLALKPGGTAFVAITHPCFRAEEFSTFKTVYSSQTTFDYFSEGQAFEVQITDAETKNVIRFYDYHWTLSTTINLIIAAGFVIKQIVELPDISEAGYYNAMYSPYVIISCSNNG